MSVLRKGLVLCAVRFEGGEVEVFAHSAHDPSRFWASGPLPAAYPQVWQALCKEEGRYAAVLALGGRPELCIGRRRPGEKTWERVELRRAMEPVEAARALSILYGLDFFCEVPRTKRQRKRAAERIAVALVDSFRAAGRGDAKGEEAGGPGPCGCHGA